MTVASVSGFVATGVRHCDFDMVVDGLAVGIFVVLHQHRIDNGQLLGGSSAPGDRQRLCEALRRGLDSPAGELTLGALARCVVARVLQQ